MNQDELQLLTQLAWKIEQAPQVQKDPQADELIRTRIGSRPDALYLLTQTVLIQNMALEQAQKQIQELQARAPQAAAPPIGAGGFLPQQSAYGQPPYAQPGQPGYGQQAAPLPPQQPQQPQGGLGGMFGGGGGGSSFLRSAGTTAAGIAAGALAFEGIKSMMGGFGGQHQASGFLGNPMGEHQSSGFLSNPLGEHEGGTVVNNYYGNDPNSNGSDDTDDVDDVDDDAVDTDDSVDSDDSGDDDYSGDSDDSGSSDDSF